MNATRRDFLKTAGAAAAVSIATTYSPFSYAQNEKVRVASIGTGGQGGFHLRDGMAKAEDLKTIAVCDVYKPHLEGGYQNAGGGDVKKYMDYREMLDKEDLDAIVIATPLNTHYQIVMDCLDAGKYVFCEKTLAYEIEHCRDIIKKEHETGRFVQVGHQRRYNPIYNHAMKLAWDEGVIGRITHIDAQWHRNNDWRRPISPTPLSPEEQKYIKDLERHINWRLYRESSGGLMTELGTHAFDVVNWFLDANPTRVFGYGGLDYWRDGRDVFDNANVIFEYEITPESRAYRKIEPRSKQQKNYADGPNFNDSYTVRVVYSSLTTNANRGASESIQGDEGTFVLTEMVTPKYYQEQNSTVKWVDEAVKDAEEENAVIVTQGQTLALSNEAQKNAKPITVDTDKSVDQLQFEGFAKNIKTGGRPKANAMVGLKSAIAGLTAMQAMRERREVIVDPAWYQFDFETDDASMYG